MLIVEELHLLLTTAKGTQESPGTQRGYGLTAALLTDLALAGCVVITEAKKPRVNLTSATPTGNPVLDFGLARLRLKNGAKLDDLVMWSKLDPIVVVTESLVSSGVLMFGDRAFLGLGKPRTPEVDPEPERRLRARLAAVLAGTTQPTAADATLLSILQGLEVAKRVLKTEADGMSGRELKKRISEIVDNSPAGDSVGKAVQSMNAAVINGAITTFVVAGS